MNTTASAVIEPLGGKHDRAAFRCGNTVLDEYIKTRAGQDEKRNFSRTFVLTGDEPSDIAGYYTVSNMSVNIGELPEEEAKKLPRYPLVPAALIGRLAVSEDCQGKGFGGDLLIDALKRIVAAGINVASYAIIVDAKDDKAVSFYEHYGFQRLPSQKSRMFLPVATASKLF